MPKSETHAPCYALSLSCASLYVLLISLGRTYAIRESMVNCSATSKTCFTRVETRPLSYLLNGILDEPARG